MSLIEQVNKYIEDEFEASNEYDELIIKVKQDSKLNENDKSLIVGILFKMSTDEETHKILLNIIKEVIDSYK